MIRHINVSSQLLSAVFFVSLMMNGLPAGVIVPGLDDSTALADYSAARAGTTTDTVENATGLLTLAARFNPDASQMTGGPFIVIEIGGTSNGTGLYLGDGNLIFACKNNNQLGLPASMNDMNFSDNALALTLGPVVFGVENKVYISMNLNTGEFISSINGITTLHTITNSTGSENLDGNHSVSFLGLDALVPGHMGGLVETGAAQFPLLFWNNAANMTQTAGYNNQRGQVFAAAVPAPQPPYSILIVESNGTTAIAEGGATDEIFISLTDDPMSDPVTITLIDASEPAQIQVVPSQIVFDTDNWKNPQSVTFTAIDDSTQEPANHTATIQFHIQVNSSSEYFGFLLDDLVVNIRENDCGLWGYDQIDTNQDCQIDLDDILNMVSSWLECTYPEINCTDRRPE
jgi:hypothetical protein